MKLKYISSIIPILSLFCCSPLSAQISYDEDWAGFSRYSEANAKVTHQPNAVFMGDSITDLWRNIDGEFFSDHDILNRGICGQTTSQMLVRFRKDVVAHHPKYAIIMAGTNDIARNTGYIALDDIAGNIFSMCEIAESNKIKPVIISITPVKFYGWRPQIEDPVGAILKVNSMLKEYAEVHDIPYVDLHSLLQDEEGGLPKRLSEDGVHPNHECYQIMALPILKVLK